MKKKRGRPSLTYHSDIDMDEMEDSDDEFVPKRSTRSGVMFHDVTETSSDDDDDDENDDEEDSENESDSGDGDSGSEDDNEDDFDETSKDTEFSEDTKEGAEEDLNDIQTDCPICLSEFIKQRIGQPENCRHLFCSDCIKEWSKTVNSCPVDRQKFNIIWIKKGIHGPVVEELYVEDSTPGGNEEEFEDPTFCQVCGNGDREDRLLLCDGCDHGYHLECLDPPLDHVPIDDWYCPACAANRQPAAAQIAETIAETRPVRRRRGGARTAGVATRVARAARAWFTGREVGASLSSFIGYLPRGARATRSRTGRKGKKRKRKTANSARSAQSLDNVVKKRKYKRKTSKKKRKTKDRKANRKGRKINETQDANAKRLSLLGSASLEPTLSFNLFGNRYDLDDFCEEAEEKPKEDPIPKKPETSNPDILSGIMESFGNLDSTNVVIKRDGTLVQKRKHRVKIFPSDSSDEEEKLERKRKLGDKESTDKIKDSKVDIKDSSVGNRESVPFGNSVAAGRQNRGPLNRTNTEGAGPRLDVKPSLEEIKSWREERKALNQEYKPMPSAAKFKSIKIPRLNKKSNDSTTEENVGKVAKFVDKNMKPIKSGRAVTSKSSSSKDTNTQAAHLDAVSVKMKDIYDTDFRAKWTKAAEQKDTEVKAKGQRADSLKDKGPEAVAMKPSSLKIEGSTATNTTAMRFNTASLNASRYYASSKSIASTQHTSSKRGELTQNAERHILPPNIRRFVKQDEISSTTDSESSDSSSPAKNDSVDTRPSRNIPSRLTPRVYLSNVMKASPRKRNNIDSSTTTKSTSAGNDKFLKKLSDEKIPRNTNPEVELQRRKSNYEAATRHYVTENRLHDATQRQEHFKAAVVRPVVSQNDHGTQIRRNFGLLNMIKERKNALAQKVEEPPFVALDEKPSNEEREAVSILRDDGSTTLKTFQDMKRLESRTVGPIVSDSAKNTTVQQNISTNPSHYKSSIVLDERTASATHVPHFETGHRSHNTSRPIAVVSPAMRGAEDLNAKHRMKEDGQDVNNLKREEGIKRLQRRHLAEVEVKKALKIHFKSGKINKDEYKLIMKKSVEKISASQSTITTGRVESLVAKYIFKFNQGKQNMIK
eukprot:Seg1585.12 transcript_id=Seg1585.12/GoldUCD/mRNA.D3Y31 product="PHD and RING finger domain-containing protein 1" protein_id=Seg1585.12/GoldUCD/D3Y31